MSTEDNKTYVDHLEQDSPLAGQKFVCLSLVTPTGDQKCDVSSVKIRGSYETEDEARKRATFLQKIDPHFNIYVAPVGRFLPICDNPDKVSDVEYQNEQLNSIIKGYKDNQAKQKEMFEHNKQEMKEQAEQMKSADYRFEKTKLEYNNSCAELRSSLEKTSDLEKLIDSLKHNLKEEFDLDVDAPETEEVPDVAFDKLQLEGSGVTEL